MSQTGNSTYVKSMNSILTFDDGLGTVIENGTITTDSFSTANFNSTNIINSDTIKTDIIQPFSDSNMYLYSDALASRTIYMGDSCTTNIGAGGLVVDSTGIKTKKNSASVAGDAINLYTATTGNISLGSTGKVSIGSSVSVTDKTIASTASTDTINLFNNITTGAVNMCKFSIKENTIASAAISDTVGFLNNLTTGTLNILTGIRTAGSINIGTNGAATNTAPINIGGDNSNATTGIISRVRLNLNGDNLWSNTASATSFRSAGSVNLATFVGSAGTINIGSEASTTSDINIGRSANGKTTNITGTNCTINPSALCTITGGTTSITGSPCSLNTTTTGTINIGDVSGTTSGALGNISIGNDNNNLATANNGICQINKARIGANGTPYRCMIIGRNLGSGSTSGTVTIPGAPSGYGLPIVFGSINIAAGSTLYNVAVNPATATTFTYSKLYWNAGAWTGASSESFNYVAYWI